MTRRAARKADDLRPAESGARLQAFRPADLRSAGSIAATYACFATLWIYYSDHALLAVLREPDVVLRWSVYKGLAFVGLTSLMLYLLMRRAFGALHASHASLVEAQTGLRASEEQLANILDGASDAIITLDDGRSIIQFNAAAERLFRCTRAAAIRTPIERFLVEPTPAPEDGLRVIAGTDTSGGRLQLEVSSAEVVASGRRMQTLVVRDVALRLRREAEVARLNRLYAALNLLNHDIAAARSRDDLLARVCRAMVQGGGFRVAWAGWRDASGTRLAPLASAGGAHDIVTALDLRIDEARLDVDPAVPALRGNAPAVVDDLDAAPADSPWREQVRPLAAGSAAAIPLHRRGTPAGTLTLYSAERQAFGDQELALLREVGNDIALALDALEAAEERAAAEQAADNERRFSDTMIESMPGIVYFYDEAGRFLRWNRNFEQVSGYTADEIAWMHPLDFFPEDERARVADRITEVFSAGDAHVEANFRSRDGSLKPYYFTGRRVHYLQRSCLVGVGIDISERLAAERALIALNENLERLVAERTAELHAALLRAEGADRLKSAFLASMSHELRTPLNSIIGFTGILLRGLAGPLNDEQAKQLGMVSGSARHLLDLINDVLDISKIEAGQMEIRAEPLDLGASVRRCVESLRPQAERQGLQLSVYVATDLGSIVSDRRRIEQILLNLLNNAIKFTDRGSVRVHAARRPASEGGAVALVRVTDTGVGIRPEQLQELFQPFRQLDTGIARLREGTGLGLAICRRLAHLLGGDIAVSSTWGSGSEFTLTLPLERTPTE